MGRVLGLTGGIASGKSTVAAILRELGVPVVDADALAREVVRPGEPAFAEIVAAFGPGVVAADGTLDRKAVADLVFADPGKRRTLEAITHPRIAAAAQVRITGALKAGAPLVIYEAALLVERGIHKAFDGLIVVAAREDVQLARVMARDGLDEAAARARLAAQLPLADKIAVATHVIENDGTRAETRAKVEALVKTLTGTP